MSPKTAFYKANSIIYFKGDESDKVFILNSGRVSLNYEDIESGKEVHDLVKVGEFFGVKSALGRYRREDTALVLADCQVVVFSVDEFEQLVLKNIPLILKMLKVFSNQLRRIQKQVQNLLGAEEHTDAEKGLFSIGEYYLKNNVYSQAIYAFKRYLVYYPSGSLANEALKNIELAESYLQKYGQGKGPAPTQGPGPLASFKPSTLSSKPEGSTAPSESEQRFYRAVSLMSQEKYEEAFKLFKSLLNESIDEEYVAKSQYEMGRCLFFLKQYEKVINLFTNWIQKYPKHPDFKDALYFIASSYSIINDKTKAIALCKKILNITPESESVYQKARKLLKQLEGAK